MLSINIKTIGRIFYVILLLYACSSPQQERFNYALIKSKLDMTENQVTQFDRITTSHSKKAREAYESNRGNREEVRKAVMAVFKEQDRQIHALLDEDQFAIYAKEIKIEREGREKHNMILVRDKLGLDSAQIVKYDLANEAFYTLLIDNHDNYHGKPDVYRQYYAEIDVNRQEAFRKLMTEDQYDKYLELAEEYKLGESEAY